MQLRAPSRPDQTSFPQPEAGLRAGEKAVVAAAPAAVGGLTGIVERARV